MAEEVRASQTGPNGERFGFKVAGQELWFSAKDIVAVLLVVALIVLGYLRTVALTHQLDQMYARQSDIFTILHQNREASIEDRHTLFARQTELMTQLRKYLIVHDQNQGKEPSARTPLEFEPDLPQQPHR